MIAITINKWNSAFILHVNMPRAGCSGAEPAERLSRCLTFRKNGLGFSINEINIHGASSELV